MDHSLSKSFNLTNYRLEASTQTDIRGKGATIYIDHSLPYKRRHDLESNINSFQTVFLEIKCFAQRPFIFSSAYRSPSFCVTEFTEYLETTLEKVCSEQKFCIIGGDFNIDILKHESRDECSQFLNSLATLGFLPIISLPTRITTHSSTLIDNFFCNDTSLVHFTTVITCHITDHLPIFAHINVKVNNQKQTHVKKETFDFRKIDELKHNLPIKLNNVFNLTDAEDASSFLLDTLSSEISNLSIKKTNRRTVPIQPWLSFSLLRCINKKNRLHKKFIHNPSEHNHNKFKTYRNQLTSLIRTAKEQYFKRKLDEQKSDPKKLWQLLLGIVQKGKIKEDLPSHFESDGGTIYEPSKIADKFNDFFCNIGSNLDALIAPSTSDPLSYLNNNRTSTPFSFSPTTSNTVLYIIQHLNDCGAGIDGISTKILKLISSTIAPHLCFLFNLCLQQGKFPSCFKRAIVVPIFKNGSPFLFNNYRPISILPVLSKVLEKNCLYSTLILS